MTQSVALIELLKVDQQVRWDQGEMVRVEQYLERHPPLRGDRSAILALITQEITLRRVRADFPRLPEYLERFRELEGPLRELFQAHPEWNEIPRTCALSELAARLSAAIGSPSTSAAEERLPEFPGYEILAELGRGGMGVVYRARHVRLNRLVALKILLTGPFANATERARFRTEAEAIARLQHPHVVQIYEVGEHEGLPFLALEYLAGGSLDQRAAGPALSPAAAAQLVETIARAVHCAHQQGILHRDLKPSNVLLAADGTPKVADFGLARLLDVDTGPTPAEAFLGTPSYAAPEQAAGKVRAVAVPADVYSLGAILYELLTGRPPFKGTSLLNTLEQVRTQEPVPPARLRGRLPRDLNAICLKCLEKEPARRYPSAAALADDLRRFYRGEPVEARPIGLLRRLGRTLRRRPTLVARVVVAMALVCVLATALWYARVADRVALRHADEKYAQLIALRDEALFYGLLTPDRGTLFSGAERAANLRTAEQAARKALDLSGLGAEGNGSEVTPPFRGPRQAAVRADGYTLLFLLAEIRGQQTEQSVAERCRAALATLDRAARLGPDTRAYHLRRAYFLTQQGEREEARKERERAAAREPRTALDHFLLGEELYRRGALDQAREAFHHALAVDPAHFWSQFFLAVCNLRLGQWEAARAGLTSCLAAQPGFVWAHLFRGLAHEHLQAHREAEDDFARAFLLDPGPDARYTLLLIRGVLRFQQKQLDRADEDFRAARALKPEQYNAYVNLAWVALARGDLDGAAKEMEQAIRLHPPPLILLDYHVQRGRRLRQAGQLEAALAACERAARIAPHHPLPDEVRARTLLALERPEQAEQAYNDYLRKGGARNADFYRGRGSVRMKRGRYLEAVDDYTHALERPDAETYLHRGWAYFFADAWKLALRDFDAALERDREQGDAWTGRGLALVMIGNYREAVKAAETALSQKPKSKEMMFNLACIFAQASVRIEADRAEPERQRLASSYRQRSVAVLRQTMALIPPQARRTFWKDTVLIDPALAPLRASAEIRPLAEEIVSPR